ncbi:MAG: hypothetical protein LKE96_11900 [Acetobacter peroxydans]|nr:hypothetical protein [Acetobacter peroxydans]
MPDTTQALADTAYTVTFTKSRREIACPSGTPVLSAARAAGMRLPGFLRQGHVRHLQVQAGVGGGGDGASGWYPAA